MYHKPTNVGLYTYKCLLWTHMSLNNFIPETYKYYKHNDKTRNIVIKYIVKNCSLSHCRYFSIENTVIVLMESLRSYTVDFYD